MSSKFHQLGCKICPLQIPVCRPWWIMGWPLTSTNATPAGNRCGAVKMARSAMRAESKIKTSALNPLLRRPRGFETELIGRHGGHFVDGGGEIQKPALADVMAEGRMLGGTPRDRLYFQRGRRRFRLPMTPASRPENQPVRGLRPSADRSAGRLALDCTFSGDASR